MLVPLALLSILPACGGSGKHAVPARVVAGPGFTYEAPAGWKIATGKHSTTASKGGAIVSVTVFALRKPYAPALFDQATAELDRVAAKLGTLTQRVTTTLAGQKARAYRYASGVRVGFVLAGRHEYEVFCRNGGDVACDLLFTSFALTS